MSCIKDNAQLLQFQSQFVQLTASSTESSALAMTDIIKYSKEHVVNVQTELSGMEICAHGHQFVKLVMLLIMLQINAKLSESIVDKMQNGMELCAAVIQDSAMLQDNALVAQ
jgi:hypothetical protein